MSDEQMIQESAARLFADAADTRLNEQVEAGQFPTALWQQIESAGFALALTGGEQGFGLTCEQALPIFTELGRHRIPAPLPETAIGLALLANGGHPLPAGPGALIDIGPGNALTLATHGGAPALSGHAQAVPWARHAHWALAQLPQGELAYIALASAQGVQIQPGLDMTGLPADTLRLDRVPVQVLRPALAETFAPPIRTLGALVHAAMMAGAMQWVLDQAVQYANDRIQFGRPIGKNQALQQALAQAAGDVASARMAVQAASLDFCLDDPARAARGAFGVAAAKIRCGEAATRTAAVAHQVLGAIGFTREHALHFATRRLWNWREAYGADAWWAQRLGQAAIRAGADAFWPAMTARQFPLVSAQA
jgi:acyl-CoA dehydrogenase